MASIQRFIVPSRIGRRPCPLVAVLEGEAIVTATPLAKPMTLSIDAVME
ncbi:hypothetical protein [Phreatobacter oligotrophus]|jgi:hypothetical protein|nr:hypothetical protein [Phreatobacter oligotrophus]